MMTTGEQTRREIRIHDTLSGELRALEPRDGEAVGIYACGPTTYGPIHIGNARPFVVFTLLSRFLRHAGYEPRLVVNVTDVNDKIYDAARAEGVPSAEWAEQMTAAYMADTDRLGLGRPDSEPRATEAMPGIVSMIERLVESDHAYESDGDVYFRVRSFPAYGRLSNRDADQMDQGEEAGSAELKEDPLDFALWKATKEGEDTSWPSPWGEGRPGWHIECSAMAEGELGMGFEIHGGGVDLVFPHHENEIAQSEAAAAGDEPLARIWMHNGMVEADASKMSKSEGNVFVLSEALDAHGPQAVVAYLISGHYRQPLAFSDDALAESARRVERIRNFLRTLPDEAPGEPDPQVVEARERVLTSLADDFNTPAAFAALFEIVSAPGGQSLPGARQAMEELLPLFGLESLFEQAAVTGEADPQAQALLEEREAARAAGDYERADRLRDEISALGWEVRDDPSGPPQLVPKGS